MSIAVAVDRQKYGKLLAKTQPKAIKTEEENERLIEQVYKLEAKGDKLTSEEKELLTLLNTLIEAYEDQHYELKKAAPHQILRELMDARGLRQSDLYSVIASKGSVSDIVNGKRGISKTQAKILGTFFHVSPALFL